MDTHDTYSLRLPATLRKLVEVVAPRPNQGVKGVVALMIIGAHTSGLDITSVASEARQALAGHLHPQVEATLASILFAPSDQCTTRMPQESWHQSGNTAASEPLAAATPHEREHQSGNTAASEPLAAPTPHKREHQSSNTAACTVEITRPRGPKLPGGVRI